MLLFRKLKRAGNALLNLLYPPHCALCLADTEAGIHLCESCRNSATRIEAPFCYVCSEPHAGKIEGRFTCGRCQERKFHFECTVTRYLHRGPVRECVHRFKYNRHFYLRRELGRWLADTLTDSRMTEQRIDAIVPVPLHSTRKRERGFNQAAVLAELLGQKAGKPVLHALQRIRYTSTQTQFDRDTRMENLRNAFRMRQNVPVRKLHLLLVDDVLTTGSTVDECARVLKQAGAASVRVATVARG
jgi:ComF family protein